jgi:hypothetical protein
VVSKGRAGSAAGPSDPGRGRRREGEGVGEARRGGWKPVCTCATRSGAHQQNKGKGMSSHQHRGSVEFGNPNPTGRRGSAVRFSTKSDRRVSMASLAGSAGGGGGGGHRDMDGAVRKKGKRAAWIKAVTGGGGDEHGSMSQTEVHVEVEPRGFSSAVSRSGRMIAKECYRCLTTVCQKWHSFGKLELRLCNGCRVLMDKKVCGYCGKEESDDLLDRNLYNCVMCLRCTHQKCEEKWRSAGHNEYKLCIVCEMGARIRDRDFKSRSLKLLEGDLPSLLNHHIFFFSRYFEGKGPKTGFLFRPRDPIVSGQLFTSGEFAHTVKEDKKKREANKGSDADASSFVSNHMATFDELLALTAEPDVHVKESSEISNIVQKFSTLNFSSVTSKEPANMTSAESIRRRRSTLGQSDGSPSLNASSDPKSTLLKSRNSLESLSADLRELGYSYLTRYRATSRNQKENVVSSFVCFLCVCVCVCLCVYVLLCPLPFRCWNTTFLPLSASAYGDH